MSLAGWPARGGRVSNLGASLGLASALLLFAGAARAQSHGSAYVEPPADGRTGELGIAPDEPTPAPAERRFGVTVDVGVESAYVSRGLNVLQARSQLDQNPIVNPSINWAIGETGFTLGLVGVYQFAGDNRAELVRAGIGNQQDVNLMFERKLTANFTGYAGLTYSFFPFADAAVAGTAVPSMIEPKVAVSLHTTIDVGLQVAYSACIQDAIASGRHLYIHPVLWKTIDLSTDDALDVSVSGGAKLWDDAKITNNVADVQADIVYSRELSTGFHARPGIHYAWTNLDNVTFEKEHVVWVSLHGGLEL